MFLSIGGNPLCIAGTLYSYVLIARAILSWFPLRSDSPFASVSRFLVVITEPLLAPFRRVIPAAGMFDFSFLVAFIVVEIVTQVVLCRL
jgi:YggT family protein